MAKQGVSQSVCPVCGSGVDPLRAGAVGVFGGQFVYFCSDACKAGFSGRASPEPRLPARRERESAAPADPAPPLAPFVVEEPGPTTSRAEVEDDADGTSADAEAEPQSPAYVPATACPVERFDWVATVLFVLLLSLGVLAAAGLAARWVDWLDVPWWMPDAAAMMGVLVLVFAAGGDMARRLGRGVDHATVGVACAALAVPSWTGSDGHALSASLAVLAVYSAVTLAERRLLSQRPPALAAASDGPGPDALLDWGGPRGPLASGLRRALRIAPALSVVSAAGALALSLLADVLPGWRPIEPILVAVALAFLPWSIRHAALSFGALARAASRANVRFLDPASVELAARTHHLVFLHRGVVTQGRPEVVEFTNYSDEPDAAILDRVASAERAAAGSPLAEAVLAYAGSRGVAGHASARLSRFLPGLGVRATSEHGEVWIGSRRMLLEEGISTGPVEEDARQIEQAGRTVLFVAARRRVQAIIGVADPARPGVAAAVETAHRLGLETHLLTGESRLTAERVARELKVRHVRPELTPEERAGEIRDLREMGGSVTVVGNASTPAEMFGEADVAAAIGVPDPTRVSCEIATASDDPALAVETLAASRRATSSVVTHLVAACAAALLNAGLSALGFLPPPATLAVTAATALFPILRKGRMIRA